LLKSLTIFLIKKNAEVGELILGIFGVTWGVWLLLPFFDAFSLSSFAGFATVADADSWGLVVLSVGLITFISANTNLTVLRRFSLLLNIFMWAFIALVFSWEIPSNPVVTTYLSLALYSFWQYIKIMLFIDMEKEVAAGHF
jgi:hypothetical protein